MNIDPAKVLPVVDVGADQAFDSSSDSTKRLTLRTVQEVVERAVREVVREPVELVGASRTDAGVHARGQVAAFTCSKSPERKLGEAPPEAPALVLPPAFPPDQSAASDSPPSRPRSGWPLSRGTIPLIRALNSRLPDDLLIIDAQPVADTFNPISDATAKAYSYTLHNSPMRPLWDRRYVHHVWVPLDLARMRDAAARFVGEHDFAAFAAAGHGRTSTVRTVFSCDVTEIVPATKPARDLSAELNWARSLRFDIAGNGFLWNMIRIIAGTLVEVGRGKLSPEDITGALKSGDRRHAGPTLPPTGLCLEWIRYG